MEDVCCCVEVSKRRGLSSDVQLLKQKYQFLLCEKNNREQTATVLETLVPECGGGGVGGRPSSKQTAEIHNGNFLVETLRQQTHGVRLLNTWMLQLLRMGEICLPLAWCETQCAGNILFHQ